MSSLSSTLCPTTSPARTSSRSPRRFEKCAPASAAASAAAEAGGPLAGGTRVEIRGEGLNGYGAVIDKINNELIDTNMAERDEKSVWYYRVWPELGLGPWPGKGVGMSEHSSKSAVLLSLKRNVRCRFGDDGSPLEIDAMPDFRDLCRRHVADGAQAVVVLLLWERQQRSLVLLWLGRWPRRQRAHARRQLRGPQRGARAGRAAGAEVRGGAACNRRSALKRQCDVGGDGLLVGDVL